MEIAHKNRKNEITLNEVKEVLTEVPKAPVYLTAAAKKHWSEMAFILLKHDLLKDKFLPVLEIYSEAMAQWEFALREIKKANEEKFGSGYFQKFTSGASNVSVFVTLKDKATEDIFKCCKQFGLDPKSEKDLKGPVVNNQLLLFQQIVEMRNSS